MFVPSAMTQVRWFGLVHAKFLAEIRSGLISNLMIEFVYWEDSNNRSFLGIIATSLQGNRYLIDLRDVSMRGHSANVIVEELQETLKIMPSKAINSIMSDFGSC